MTQHFTNAGYRALFTPRFIVTALLSIFAAMPVRAASVSYFLDQSNALPDDTNYLSVTLNETGGGVMVSVATLGALNAIAGRNFGIQAFGFDLSSQNAESAISGQPAGWTVGTGDQMSEFGRFDIRLQGQGNSRTQTLSFLVEGTDLTDFGSLFAVHVAGFQYGGSSSTSTPDCSSNGRRGKSYVGGVGSSCSSSGRRGTSSLAVQTNTGSGITSAFFGNDPPVVVPLPGALWLMGTGILALFGIGRRRAK